jgi:predicted permease
MSAHFARSRSWWGWTRDACMILGVGGLILVLTIWLESQHEWWTDAAAEYIVFLILGAGMAGNAVSWALDDVEDPQQERKILIQAGTVSLVAPLVVILGSQALGVAFDRSPGTWPSGADVAARVVYSLSAGISFAALVYQLVRRAHRRLRVWVVGALFSTSLAVLGAWPWLGSSISMWVRVTCFVAPLVVATRLASPMPPGH